LVSGLGILSRYPLGENTITTLQRPPHPFWYDWFYLDRLAQKTTIAFKTTTIALWNVHLEAFHRPTRIDQARTLSDIVAQDATTHKIVVGDFNDPTARDAAKNGPNAIAVMTENKTLVAENAPIPEHFTFPAWGPIEKLDHILFSRGLYIIEAGKASGEASDHLPVWARLAVADEPKLNTDSNP
jgi:endonuclease/exonuclease/phosphatase family metal-dependent hydrolase